MTTEIAMTMCIILDDSQRQVVQSGVNSGELYDQYGVTKGYLDDNELHPVRRQGGGTNPNPCFILNVAVLSNSNFASAQPYLSGLPQKDSADGTFPPPYSP